MKPLRRPLCLALTGALSLLGASSSSPMWRIKAKHAHYETWPIDVLEAVVRQKASAGMTPAVVEVALGKPTEVQSRVGKVGPEDGWIDQKSSAALRGLLRHTGLSVRGGGVSTGTPGRRASSTTPTNADDQEIVFRHGPVLRGASSPAPRARRPPPHQWSDRLPRSHSTAPPSAATKKNSRLMA